MKAHEEQLDESVKLSPNEELMDEEEEEGEDEEEKTVRGQ